ncbi:hypothetical protein [Sphingomonas sp. KC8]|uniref:hypothetical protein n=1 Tax=Sphingomonas sp. KC8 TaxID=1030157 RepID=UPI0002489BFC|nr:hypothetical protein [Sphingomonas sp. KC8]ARS27865.1 hypothetical protein KC8_11270 [Sphingomonas sp. KC8]
MIRPIFAAAMLALPLAGCGSGTPDTGAANITVPAVDYAERIRAMGDNERNAVLYRAIDDAGRDCQQVTSSSAIDAINGAPAWVATCEDGGRWTIILGKDGIAQVTNATELGAAKAP